MDPESSDDDKDNLTDK